MLQNVKKCVLERVPGDPLFTRYMENKIQVQKSVLKEFIELDETLNNIFEYLFECLRLVSLNCNFQ